MREKTSFGKVVLNEGGTISLSEDKYILDHTRSYIIFDVIPMGAVRMTQSDRWKTNPNHPDPKKRQRDSVTRYFAFKQLLTVQAKQAKFTLGNFLDAVYLIPMPASWSKKKKAEMVGKPCMVKPDLDNITKAVKDTLKLNDSDIWWEKAEKRWAYKGSIILFR